MNKKCPNCRLVNFANADNCRRCDSELREITAYADGPSAKSSRVPKILVRVVGLFAAVFIALFGFYVSLLVSAKRPDYEQKQLIDRAVQTLDDRGFSRDVVPLRYLTAYRVTDNWLNASTREENAYAATNFPFEIMTIYPDFYKYPVDDVERAAVLLHESQHLRGADEPEAYEYVWRNRKKLGWTRESYGYTDMWQSVRKLTSEFAPHLFVCEGKEFRDCTE